MSLIGIHTDNVLNIINDSDGITLLDRFDKLALIQTFVSTSIDYSDKKFDAIRYLTKSNKLKLVIHSSYSINLSRSWTESDWWIQQFIAEIDVAYLLGGFAIVVHTGKQLNLTESVAINNMYSSLLYIHAKTKHANDVKILIETPSGQGTETLTDINKMCRFISKFSSHPNLDIQSRIGVCFDTCHVFASGHDIRSKRQLSSLFKQIDSTIGIDKIKLCHLNDSKKDLGSNVDRHENIGSGYLGKKVLIHIVKFFNDLNIPMILETPREGLIKDYRMLILNKNN
jgi:deoxyribonuclease-4